MYIYMLYSRRNAITSIKLATTDHFYRDPKQPQVGTFLKSLGPYVLDVLCIDLDLRGS